MDRFDLVLGCAVRWTCVCAVLLGIWYWLAQVLWGRITVSWKLAMLNTLRRDTVKREQRRRS